MIKRPALRVVLPDHTEADRLAERLRNPPPADDWEQFKALRAALEEDTAWTS